MPISEVHLFSARYLFDPDLPSVLPVNFLKHMTHSNSLCSFALAGVLAVWSNASFAYGALAIGVPESVTLDGISVGFSWNAANADAARVEALKSCLDLKTAPLQARALCTIVTTFRHRCFSIALDHPGGAGWGWAVESSVAAAEGKALQTCKSTVRKSCRIAFAQCDVSP